MDTSEACRNIVALASGWDKHGALGPRPPLSWETVARMAMDYARVAIEEELVMFDQRGQQVGIQVNMPNAVATFRAHRDRYQDALEAAQSQGDAHRAELLAARLAALKAFALEIGIDEA